jgi:hypothetical protein
MDSGQKEVKKILNGIETELATQKSHRSRTIMLKTRNETFLVRGAIMTRIAILFVSLVLLGFLSHAQNPPEQPGMGSRMDQERTSGMGMHHPMHEMSTMHEQMMKDMQVDLDTMRSNLQKMKDQIGKVSDRGTKDQLQLNIDMWQSLIDHMDRHMATMKKMMSAHKGAPADATKHDHEQAPATPKQ